MPHVSTALVTSCYRIKVGGKLWLVQCVSRFLTDAETRYATIELEMLATVWAMHKCGYYLKGLQTFEHVTDHRPLIPILNHHTLDAVENPRLQRLKEKLSPFVFTVRWRAGKQLCIPDALSRYPDSCPTEDGDMLAGVLVKAAVAIRAVHSRHGRRAVHRHAAGRTAAGSAC